MALRIGIDIGSTTVKVVVLDAQNKLLFRSYERHYSKTRERTCETLRGLRGLLGGQQVQLLITGSATWRGQGRGPGFCPGGLRHRRRGTGVHSRYRRRD